jgi:uncharacterized damage-inducible protein DinB
MMGMIDGYLPEFDREMGTTRRLLERVPFDNPEWQPHPKSMSLLKLSTHIADIPNFAVRAMTGTSFDAAAPREPRPTVTSAAELVARFDANVAAARETLVGKTDPELLVPWKLLANGKEIFTLPRVGVLRSLCLNHISPHRGQLSVSLRLRDVSRPSIYGPSADEAM